LDEDALADAVPVAAASEGGARDRDRAHHKDGEQQQTQHFSSHLLVGEPIDYRNRCALGMPYEGAQSQVRTS
jgi:hypothetical protein